MGISREDALECFRSDDLIGIGMEADAVRRRLHPEGVVSYGIDRRIRYADGLESVCDGIRETVEMGGTGITLAGEVSQEQSLEWFEQLLRGIKGRFPAMWVHGLTASAVLEIAALSGLTVEDTVMRLRDAGLDSIAGDDAEILDDSVDRQDARSKWKASEWVAVHRAAHRLGMRTTAAMSFGGGETIEHRVNHLETVRRLQEETGGFTAFTPWSFQPRSAGIRGFEEATAVEYLKTLAISRMFLDTVENVQSHLETQGLKVLQVGLRFGGNDVGSLMLDGSASPTGAATEEQLRQVIRDAGFRPVQRDTVYRTMFLS
jgi:cyclic dehypoxanthinyl futalosine synthase